MRLSPMLGGWLTTLLFAQLANAAPVVSTPLDVAPRLSVESTHTTERVRAIAAGAGKIVTVWDVGGARFFDDDLGVANEPIDAPFAESSVAFDGESFVFAGDGGGFQRYRPDGTKLDAAPVYPSGGKVAASTSPNVACRAVGACAVVFTAKFPGAAPDAGTDVFFASFDAGVVGAPVRLTTAKNDQSLPKIVWDGTNWIVAWNDQRFVTGSSFSAPGTQYYGARVSTSGQVLDPLGKALTTFDEILGAPIVPNSSVNLPTPASLLRHGGDTWLVWYGRISGQILARRFDGALASQDATPRIVLDGTQGFPWSIAAQDTELAVFTTIKGNGQPQEIQMVRVPDTGPASAPTTTGLGIDSVATAVPTGGYAVGKTLFGTPVPGLNSTYDTWVSRVSAAGVVTKSSYASAVPTMIEGRAFAYGPAFGVVAYSDNRGETNSPTAPRKVYVAAVAGAESVTPADGTFLTNDYAPGTALPLFDAAASAGVALVVWNEGGTTTQDVLGAFVDASGNIVKRVTIASEAYNETSARVAFDGTNFVVAWLDAGNGYDVPVYRRIAPDGTFVDPALTLLAPSISVSTLLGAVGCDLAGACAAVLATTGDVKYAPFTGTTVAALKSRDDIGLFANVNQPSIAGGDKGFAFLLASQQTGTTELAQRVSGDLVATDKAQLTVLGSVSASLGTRADAGWNGKRFVFGRVSDKTLDVGSVAPTGAASKPLVLATNIRPQPAPWTDNAVGLRAPLQIGGADGRTIVGYPDNGRYWVLGIDDVANEGGAGTAGSGGGGGGGGGGGTAGASGTAGKSGSGGTAGNGGSAGTGAAGNGGTAGAGGAAGKGGTGGTAGSAGNGGSAGTVGTAGNGGSQGGKGGTTLGTAGSNAGTAGNGGTNAAGAGTSPAASDASADSGGCGCRVPTGVSDDGNARWVVVSLLGLGAVAARRKSRAARRS